MGSIERRKLAVKKLRKDSGSPSGILMAVVERHVVVDFDGQDSYCLTPHEARSFAETLMSNAVRAAGG